MFTWNFCICNSPSHQVIWLWCCSQAWNHGAALQEPKGDLDWICPFVPKVSNLCTGKYMENPVWKSLKFIWCLTKLLLGTSCYHSSWIFNKFNICKRFINIQVQEWPQENPTGPFILLEKCISSSLRSSSRSSEAFSPPRMCLTIPKTLLKPRYIIFTASYLYKAPYSATKESLKWFIL